MPNDSKNPTWWELHLKKSRWEKLTIAEQQIYETEIARHDQADSGQSNIEELKQLRANVNRLAQENDELRARLAELESEIEVAENALSKETQELLRIQE